MGGHRELQGQLEEDQGVRLGLQKVVELMKKDIDDAGEVHLQKLWRWRYRSCRHLSSLRGVSPSLNRTVTCMVLKANDRRTSCPCHDEFRGPRSDYVRQVALATAQQQQQERCTLIKNPNCRERTEYGREVTNMVAKKMRN
ncbi:hypothetical protein TNCV_710021 [Trichonephila clavipes]|nr:hypothetical protein TNCV_710021 [Trichonephila clavipes]